MAWQRWRGAALLLAWALFTAGCGAGGAEDGGGTITLNEADGGALDGATSSSGGSSGGASSGGSSSGSSSGADVQDPEDSASPQDSGATRRSRDGCPTDACGIGSSCVKNGDRNPDNPCQVCLVVVRADDWSADDTAKCDDGKACTSDDTCTDGKCQGAALTCNDSNPCTTDTCAAGDDGKAKCSNTPNTDPCSDGDVCSVGDTCDAGKCKAGKARDCDDGNACTKDTCKKASGCAVQALTGTPCEDGEKCTLSDTCAKGLCAAGKVDPCDDDNACTLDGCMLGGGCKHKDIAALCKDDSVCTEDKCDAKQGCVYGFTTEPCDDASKCTVNDTCKAGFCVGDKVPVDDKNPCTNDSCDPLKGVLHEPNTLPCDDGDKCTVDDVCKAAKCVAGPPKVCKDDNVCTDDGCNAKTGCIFEHNTEPCDDGSACTEKDKCAKAKCEGAKISCDDGNACTADSCDAGTIDKKGKGCVNTLIVSNKCRPNIDITYPKRGATIKQTSSTVTIKGKVTSGAGPITSFSLNGQKIALKSDGTFSFARKSAVGGNTLVFDAQDKMGSKRHRVQAYLWSKTYFKPDITKPKSGMVAPGMAFFMDDKTIDDGNHSLPPNDLATIFELYFKNMDIQKLLSGKPGEPAFTQSFLGVKFKVYIDKITYDAPKVTLKPITGALKMTATIPNLKADIRITRPKLFGGTSTYKGTITSTSVVINATVIPKVVGGKIQSEVKDVDVVLNGFKINVSGGLGGTILNWVLNAFKGQVQKMLQAEFEKAIKDQIGPAIASALNAMAISFDFDLPRLDDPKKSINIKVITDIWKTDFKTDGARFGLRAGAYTKKTNSVSNLGVPGRVGCGSGTQILHLLRKDKLELGLADDALNNILYAAWLGKLLEFPLPASMLGSVDLKQYGVTDLKMKATAYLAPTITDCNAKKLPVAHIGDFRVDAEMKLLGQKMDVVLWATFEAGVSIKAANGKLSLALTKIEKIDTEINVAQDKLIGSEAIIDKMIGESLVKGLMGTLGGKPIGEFPLPKIDLSKAVAGLPKGTGIEIDPKKVTRKEGNSIVGGQLK